MPCDSPVADSACQPLTEDSNLTCSLQTRCLKTDRPAASGLGEMLGWLRHKATPTADAKSTDSDDPQHHAEERLGKLLDRLGNETHATATTVEVALREVVASPISEPAAETGEPGGLIETPAATGREQEYVAGVDPDDYREALPLLRQAMAAVGGSAEDDSGMLAVKIVAALRERHGFTPDLLSDISPYLEQFVRDVHAGTVQLEAA